MKGEEWEKVTVGLMDSWGFGKVMLGAKQSFRVLYFETENADGVQGERRERNGRR